MSIRPTTIKKIATEKKRKTGKPERHPEDWRERAKRVKSEGGHCCKTSRMKSLQDKAGKKAPQKTEGDLPRRGMVRSNERGIRRTRKIGTIPSKTGNHKVASIQIEDQRTKKSQIRCGRKKETRQKGSQKTTIHRLAFSRRKSGSERTE